MNQSLCCGLRETHEYDAWRHYLALLHIVKMKKIMNYEFCVWCKRDMATIDARLYTFQRMQEAVKSPSQSSRVSIYDYIYDV